MLVVSATSLTRLPLTAARPASDPPRMALLRFEPDFPADSSVAGALTDLIRSNVASFPDFEVTATSEAVTSANADRPAAVTGP